MEHEPYDKIARKIITTKSARDKYVKFMTNRFPKKDYYTTQDYAEEWAYRFESGNPRQYMDIESLKNYDNDYKKDNDDVFRKALKKK